MGSVVSRGSDGLWPTCRLVLRWVCDSEMCITGDLSAISVRRRNAVGALKLRPSTHASITASSASLSVESVRNRRSAGRGVNL